MNTKPTPTQIKVLMSDWLGNLRLKDEGNYTHKGKGGIAYAGKVADYLIGDARALRGLDAIKTGRQAAVNVVNSIIMEPATVTVGGEGSYHMAEKRSHHINLATDYFDDASLTRKQAVSIMLGLAAHEAAHAAFTDEKVKMKMLEDEPAATRELRKEIWNIIEDERIEYHLGEQMPGYSELLGTAKSYYFVKLLEALRKDGKMPTEPLPKLLSALTQAVRYPSMMTKEEAAENFEELDRIRKVLTPYPLTPEAAADASGKIMDILRDIIRKQLQEQKRKERDDKRRQEESAGQRNNQQDGGKDGNDGSPNPEPSLFDMENPQAAPAGSQPANGKDSTSGNESGKDGGSQKAKEKGKDGPVKVSKEEIQKAIEKALGTDEAKKVIEAISQDGNKTDGNNSSSNLTAIKLRYVNDDDAENADGTGAGDGNPSTFIFKPKGDALVYSAALRRVRAQIPAMSKALACKSQDIDYQLRGLPSGKLNTNKLASYACGNRNIFDKKGKITCSGASVCILIDESMSMRGSKQLYARDAAILISEAVKRIDKVRFFCYGYGANIINIYAEDAKTSRWALSGTEAHGGTPTGQAMLCAAKRIRKRTGDPVLMLVLTDGEANNTALVIKTDGELRKAGFHVIGVGINTDAVKKSFEKYTIYNDITIFAPALGKLTKGILDRMLIRTEN